jgi:hypothetical protein
MQLTEKEALERIKGLVRTQVVRNEGEDNTPPSFFEIYNLACAGLGEDSSARDIEVINNSVSSRERS